MSRFEPVFLEPGRELLGKASQTFLRHYNRCRRSAFLYQETKGIMQTVEMVRGSCAHSIYEKGTLLMIENGEPKVPPELVKVLVDEELARFPLPIEEHDFVREQAYRWASEWTIDPEAVVACETLFVLRIGRYEVRCKVDHGELNGRQLLVNDYKTGKGAPLYSEISFKRTDGSIGGRNFQLILYALAMIFGYPVRVEMERCRNCESDPETADVDLCASCGGTGWCRVEHVEPFPVAAQAQEVIASFVYPAIEDGEKRMLRQPVGFTRLELEAYMGSLEAILASLERSEEEGDWPAVVSDAACEECPARALCPIPKELRDYRGEINSLEELQEACEVYFIRGKQREADRKEIKALAKALGGPMARVRFGKDRVWELGDLSEKTEIKDKDGLFEAVQLAVTEGVPFRRADFEKVSKTTPFRERALTQEELDHENLQRQEESSE